MKKSTPTNRTGPHYERESVGIARVIIPKNQDRDTYIQHCLQCSTISIMSRVNLDIIHDVDIDPSILQNINFPVNSTSLGSTVVWVNIPVYNRPIIVAKLNNKNELSTGLEESSFAFSRRTNDSYVNLSGKARGSQINITCQTNRSTGGNLRINISNKKGTAAFDVTVNGDTTLFSNALNITLRNQLSLVLTDGKEGSKETTLQVENSSMEFRLLEEESGFRIEEELFSIGKADDVAVLGGELKSFMESLIDVISSQTVVTSLGPQPLVNAAGIKAMKKKIDPWLSKYLKIQ